MFKYNFKTEQDFNIAIQEAKDKKVKITYKNEKPFKFPGVVLGIQIYSGEQNKRNISEIILYNKEDFAREPFNINNLLYSEVLFVSETNMTFNVGKAYVKGIMYKDDNKSNEIDYCYINYIPYIKTGDDVTDRIDTLVGRVWKDKIYPEDILAITKPSIEYKNDFTEPIF